MEEKKKKMFIYVQTEKNYKQIQEAPLFRSSIMSL